MSQEDENQSYDFTSPTKTRKKRISGISYKSPNNGKKMSSASFLHPRSPIPNKGIVIDRRNYNGESTLDQIRSNTKPIIKIDFGGIFRAKTPTNAPTISSDADSTSSHERSDELAISLAEALSTNTTVIEVNLPGNSIGTEGAIAFASALASNTSLVRLYLNDNDITNEGALALADALSVNTTLVYLALKRNNIDMGVEASGRIDACLARNVVWKDLGGGLAMAGPAFFVSMTTTTDTPENGKETLEWTNRAWEACTGDGKALTFLHRALESLVLAILESTSSSSSSDAEESNDEHTNTMPQQSKQLLDWCLSKGHDSYNTILQHLVHTCTDVKGRGMLQIVASLESNEAREFYTFLTEEIGCDENYEPVQETSTVEDYDTVQETFTDAAQETSTPTTVTPTPSPTKIQEDDEEEVVETKTLFLGQYDMEDGPPIYTSKSYKIQYALDIQPWEDEDEKHHLVALKVFTNRNAFYRELHSFVSITTTTTTTQQGKEEEEEKMTNLPIVSGEDIPKHRNLYNDHYIVNILRYHDVVDDDDDGGGQSSSIYCIVLPRGLHNINHIFSTGQVPQRILDEISRSAIDIALALQHLHTTHGAEESGDGGGIVYGDVRPHNIVFLNGKYKLVASNSVVKDGDVIPNVREESTGFVPPEFARIIFEEDEDDGTEHSQQHPLNKKELIAHRTFDIWSYGVLMYHMLTGEPLFNYDTMDNLTDEVDKVKLMNWGDGLTPTQLDEVLEGYNPGNVVGKQVDADEIIDNAKDFLRKCLMECPEDRFQSMSQVLSHPFLRKEEKVEEEEEEKPTTPIVTPTPSPTKEVPLSPSAQIFTHDSSVEMVNVDDGHVKPTCFYITPYKLQWDDVSCKLVLPPNDATEYSKLTLELQEWSVLHTILTLLEKEEESMFKEMITCINQTAVTDKVKAVKDLFDYAGILEGSFLAVQQMILQNANIFFGEYGDPMKYLSEELTKRKQKWIEMHNSSTDHGFFYLVDEANRVPIAENDNDADCIYPITIENKNSEQYQTLLSYMELSSFEMIGVVASVSNNSSTEIFSCLNEKSQRTILRVVVLAETQMQQTLSDFLEEHDSHNTFAGLCCISDQKRTSFWSTQTMKEYFDKDHRSLDLWRETNVTKNELVQTKNVLQNTHKELETTEKELENVKSRLNEEENKNTELQEKVQRLESTIKKQTKPRNEGAATTQAVPEAESAGCGCFIM